MIGILNSCHYFESLPSKDQIPQKPHTTTILFGEHETFQTSSIDISSSQPKQFQVFNFLRIFVSKKRENSFPRTPNNPFIKSLFQLDVSKPLYLDTGCFTTPLYGNLLSGWNWSSRLKSPWIPRKKHGELKIISLGFTTTRSHPW